MRELFVDGKEAKTFNEKMGREIEIEERCTIGVEGKMWVTLTGDVGAPQKLGIFNQKMR